MEKKSEIREAQTKENHNTSCGSIISKQENSSQWNHTKSIKIDMPKFNRDNMNGWLFKVE